MNEITRTTASVDDILSRIHTYRPAAVGLEFGKAGPRLLRQHGLPVRPRAAGQPLLRDKWDRTMALPLRQIRAELAVNYGIIHGPSGVIDNNTSSIWSGAAIGSPPPTETFVTVSANWVVPDAAPPPSAWNGNGYNDGVYRLSTWVGIDGYGTSQVLQAGTATVVTVSGGVTSVSIYAWHEWYDDVNKTPEVQVTNFPVSGGDLISCLVCAPQNNHGFVSIANLTTDVVTSIGIDAPPNVTLQGTTAEWILERPSKLVGNTVTPYTLPDYGAQFFYDAVAGSKTKERDLSASTLLDMKDGSTVVSTAVEENLKVLMTRYSG
jgi:Peptidase A4 family.